ncbi:NAD-dependent malic enzyme [candidate division SR1 bacterium Aalborg_AAW-1]|nr:NAD-dependent malic enzyme [candidate division SR1 bacterium Aalborg_AAW-1]
MSTIYEQSLAKHKEYKGKLAIHSKVPLDTRQDLSTYYSPGVAAPCLEIQKDPETAYDYTWKNNSVAVVSDGTAVLGLGNIGGIAGLPVMEGKSILFKEFGNVDAVPIVLEYQDINKTVETIINIAPSFGGINLEDIKAPECFTIEEQLKAKLNIPVFHDDQHGTAIVVLAGLINALKITNRDITTSKIVVSGAGAAGIAITKLLALYGSTDIIMIDSKGAIYEGRDGLNSYKESLTYLNKENKKGKLSDIISGTDIFIGVSGQVDDLSAHDIKSMNPDPIIFALSNPTPEVNPEVARQAGAAIIATGRSDYPNQLNNVLVFPGLFRGILDGRIVQITDDHKLAAAIAIANYVDNPTVDEIIPNPLDKQVATIVAEAVKKVG